MENVIEINKMTKTFGNKIIFSDVTTKIKKGIITCIVGENGIGKSTLLNCILGIENIDSGQICINNIDIRDWKRADYNNIGVQFQNANFQKTITVYDACKEMALMYNSVRNIDSLLNQFNLSCLKNKKVAYLSSGQRQKLKCAIALISNPEILIFDEPTVGLDIDSRDQFLREIKSLNYEEHNSIIFVSHYIEEVAYLANQLIIIESEKKISKISLGTDQEENYRLLRTSYFRGKI